MTGGIYNPAGNAVFIQRQLVRNETDIHPI
jgi:hypothetical protein